MTAPVRLPLQQQADNHLLACQRELARKRRAAFAGHAERAALRAAYDEMSRTHPHLPAVRYEPPIRANAPLAGDAGFDWESRAPAWRWQDRVIVGAVIVAGVACWLGIAWLAWHRVVWGA